MKIETVKLSALKPYENNPRNNDKAVEYLVKSIREFGFKVPIVIDRNNVIVTGHTRYKAAQRLGIREIPCIRADDLTDDQVKAFRLVDNKVGEIATWDMDRLEVEIAGIDIDLSEYDFEISIPDLDPVEADTPEDDDEGYYGDERERTNRAYNLDLIDWDNLTNDFWQMPIIQNDGFIPDDLIGFNYAKSSERTDCGIHFYVDDYQFERVWSSPENYTEILQKYQCVLSPDFSLYMDMPMPMKIWNIYRSRQIGAYYQSHGIKVIPTISWAEQDTFAFCFKGIPEGSVVSISTIEVKENKDALQVWMDGAAEMMRQIQPSAVLVYGGKLNFDYGGAKVVYFENKVTENWKKPKEVI